MSTADPSQLSRAPPVSGTSTISGSTTIIATAFDEYTYEYEYDIEDSINSIPLDEALPVTFTYSVTLLLGLVGNVLVIFSIAYYRRMRTTTNVFLLSLASADLLLVLICVPVKAAAFLSFHWDFGEPLCKIVHYVQNLSMICSVLTLTCISLERGIAVAFPLRARTMCTMLHARVVVVVVWILSCALAIPIIFGMQHTEVGERYKVYWCIKHITPRELYILYEMYMLVLMFIIPVGVMVITYVIICLKVWQFTDMRTDMRHGRVIAPANKDRLRSEVSGADSVLLNSSMAGGETRPPRSNRKKNAGVDDTRTTKQLILMLVVVVVLFAICWGPILINNVLVAFGELHHLHYGYLKPMRIAFNLMSYINSCINPIVYAFMSKNFRQSFKFAICACVRGKAFIRAYRFTTSFASTRTSAMSGARLRPGSAMPRDKSSSSGNENPQIAGQQEDEIMELCPMSKEP